MMWGRKQRANASGRQAGLFFDNNRIAVASIENGRVLGVTATNRDDADSGSGLIPSLSATVLDRTGFTSVLPAGSYELLLVDLPNVPRAEVADAIRWQIRDLIKFPAEEAIIEIFDIPQQSNPGSKAMAYAVVARRSTLQQHFTSIHEAGLSPAAVDIPELCIRNIAALLPQDIDGVALLYVDNARGILTVTRQGLLYFFRDIDTGLNSIAAVEEGELALDDDLSGILLEVQRSLDYYESHYDRRPVTELVVTSSMRTARLPEMLRDQLGLAVSALDLSAHFELTSEIPLEHSAECLLAIGAALRTEALAA
jgi:MSHA biogenesis protein MshI